MEYTDLTILDCNRQHSIQAISGNDDNTALFTNELGRGIELNVGDKVSVQGAYVSDIGAGSDTIELKGINFGKSRTIKYIKEVKEYPTTPQDQIDGTLLTPLINGFQRIKSSEDTFTYDLKDNETYITNQYYLNSNGESGYVFLPRRFVYPDTLDKDLWDKMDDFDTGMSLPQTALNFASCDYSLIFGGDHNQNYNEGKNAFKLSHDNRRLTLMRRLDATAYHTDLRATILREDGTQITGSYPLMTEPCRDTYAIYKDYYKVSVTEGFNTPENIGEEVTKQLKNADAGDKFTIVDKKGLERDITLTFNTNNYKPFLCGSTDTFSKSAFEEYNDSGDLQKVLNYQSNYYNIYCLRPEIREAGQKVNQYYGETTLNLINGSDRSTTNIITSLLWTNENLENLRDLFKAEKLYPELFNNENFFKIQGRENIYGIGNSVENVRFLHINPAYYIYTSDNYLGGDNFKATAVTDTSRYSLPLFIYYDKENENTYTEGQDINNLCYGFALKHMVGTTAYIELEVKALGGVNPYAFVDIPATDPVRTRIRSGTRIGFDWSFNAYGSVCACGLNNRCDKDYAQINEWGIINASASGVAEKNSTSGLLRYNYVGATNPIFRYDTNQSRFFFSQLHTPEVSGQAEVQAGDMGQTPIPPDNTTNGGTEVYKINKRVNRYTYTPNMRPYDVSVKGKYKYPPSEPETERTISIKNRNIKSWCVFDSVCGVFISDLGYDKEDFSRGLWGILGFSYDDLFSPITAENNRLVRVTPDRKSQSLITTNSTIVSTDTRDYIVNQFGAVYFTTQIPSSSIIEYDQIVAEGGGMKVIQVDPAITQGTNSIEIIGRDLPRRMLKPYYTIRSDIIDDNHYIGGENSKTILPVVAICDKQYSGNDFIFGADNQFTFTITKKKVITSITTAITDPNQSFASVDPDSAVIYKIMKNVRNDESLVSEYLKNLEKQRKK
jgi:hypothetical protein